MRSRTRSAPQEADLLEAVVDAVPVGLVLVDSAGRFKLLNPDAQRILGGVRSEGATGTAQGPAGNYDLLRADGSASPAKELPLVRVLERGESVDNVEMVLRREDGTEARLLVSARPTPPLEGKDTPGAVAMLVD